jgi:hypothetical protein
VTAAKPRGAQSARTPGTAENKANGNPAVFDLDAYMAEVRRTPFLFTLGGETFEMPHLADMDWHASTVDGKPADATVHDMMKAGLGDRWKAFDACKLTADGYNELWKRWQAHSGIDLGEDDASPGS